jgi:hypothetical protein
MQHQQGFQPALQLGRSPPDQNSRHATDGREAHDLRSYAEVHDEPGKLAG